MIRKKLGKKFPLLLVSFLFLSNNSFAETEVPKEEKAMEETVEAPKKRLVNGRFIAEIYGEDSYKSTDSNYKMNNEYAKSYLDLNINLTNNIFIKSLTAMEPTNISHQTPPNGTDRHFENESLFTRELSLNYQGKNFSVGGGKINNLNFGRYWNNQNRIWSINLNKGTYRQIEKLGLKADYAAGNEKKNGRYIFGLSVFTNDSKWLDNGIITDRSGTGKSAGTPGDSRSLNSYIASMDIDFDFGNEEKLFYHFSYMNLAVNERQSPVPVARISDEKGIAMNMNYQLPLNANFILNPIVEYVTLYNYGGDSDVNAQVLTLSVDLRMYKNWNLSASNVTRAVTQAAANGVDTSISELNIGYKFTEENILKGLQIILGVKRDTIDDKVNPIHTNTAGGMVRYVRDF